MIHFTKNEETGRTRGAQKRGSFYAFDFVTCLKTEREMERKRKKGKGEKREKKASSYTPTSLTPDRQPPAENPGTNTNKHYSALQ